MQHWTKCILVLAWKMVIGLVGAQCPSGFNCADRTSCYLIYPGSNGLEYQDPDGTTWSFDDKRLVYPSPNCYKYIPMNGAMQSCNDTQHECEKLGGNITVINSIEEEDALTGLVHHILTGFDIKFKVFNQEVDLGINKGCATFTIHNYISEYKLFMANTNCFSAHQIDAIICESSDVNFAKICPKPRTTSPPNEEDPPTISVRTTAILVSVILTILLSCFLGCIRHKQRTTNLGNGTDVIRYQVTGENVHGIVLHRPTTAAIAQNYYPISVNEVVYRDIEVKYDDTAAAKEVVWRERSKSL